MQLIMSLCNVYYEMSTKELVPIYLLENIKQPFDDKVYL